jgi:cGMP-dependent protein kinase 1
MGCCTTINSQYRIKLDVSGSLQTHQKNIPVLNIPLNHFHSTPSPKTVPAAEGVLLSKEKSEEDIENITNSLNSHFLFKHLTPQKISEMILETKLYKYNSKETVFTQGDPSAKFYIIESGTVKVRINHHTKNVLKKGRCFGELGLIHNTPRTATIKTAEVTLLWVISQEVFSSAVSFVSALFYAQTQSFFSNLEITKGFDPEFINQLLSKTAYHEYNDSDIIIKQDDPGDILYLIQTGTVKCYINNTFFRILSAGEIFGEQALIYNIPRTCTITSIGKVVLLSFGREAEMLLNNNLKIAYKNIIKVSLESNYLLKHLSETEHDRIIESLEIRRYSPLESIIHKGGCMGDKVYIILKKNVFYLSKVYEPGDIIGIDELYSDKKTFLDSDLKSNDEVVVGQISKEDLDKCIDGSLSDLISKFDLLSVIKKINLLRSFPTDKVKTILKIIKIVTFSNKTVVFQQGQIPDALYIVKQGQVEIVRNGGFVRYVTKNDYFGERSIILNELRTADAIALENCEFWALSKEDFLDIIDENIRNQLNKRIIFQDDEVQLETLSIAKVLGTGIYGEVLLAIHKQTKFKYALKTILKSKVSSNALLDHFAMEKKVMLQLDHPMVCKLVKTFKDSYRIYFLLEFVHGIDLYEVLQQYDTLDNETARFYVACLLLVLEYLHERNIVHRDLKPENVMIDEEGYPKLVDFGTSKIIVERTYTVIGTPHYMAPEIIKGFGYDVSCDYWSLGVMLYEFIEGGLPFGNDKDDIHKVYESILNRKLVFDKHANPECRSIINRLLSLDPKTRGTAQSIKSNSWFMGLNWDYLLSKQIKSGLIPTLEPLGLEDPSTFKEIAEVTYKQMNKHKIKKSFKYQEAWDNSNF